MSIHSTCSSSSSCNSMAQESFRRVKGEEGVGFVEKLEHLENKDAGVKELIAAMNDPQGWGHSSKGIIQHPEMPYYAAAALKEGHITDHQFGSLILYWNTKEQHREIPRQFSPEICPIFDHNGQPIEKNINCAFETLGVKGENSISLNPEERARWIEEMKKLPRSEQQFLVTPCFAKPTDMLFRLNEVGLDIFTLNDSGNEITPTMGMMQAVLKAKYGENAVRLLPVIGSSSLLDIKENGLQATRDVGLRFPGISLPEKADTFNAPRNEFSKHDFYHAVVASAIPDSLRKRIVQASDVFIDSLDTLDPAQKRSHRLGRNALIDMEHRSFSQEETSDVAFWIAIRDAFLKPVLENQNKPNNPCEEIKPELELKLLRKICQLAIEEHDPVAIGPTTAFEKYKVYLAKTKQEELNLLKNEQKKNKISPFYYFGGGYNSAPQKELIEKLFSPDFFDRVTTVWNESLGVKTQENFKKSFLAAPNEAEKKQALKNFASYISPENVTSLLLFSLEPEHKALCADLTQHCMQYIAKNFLRIAGHPEFKALDIKIKRPLILKIRKSADFKDLFIQAMKEKNTAVLELFMLKELNSLDSRGFTMLDYAVDAQDMEVVKTLLGKGANPNPLPDSQAVPAGFVALEHGNAKLYWLLCGAGFNAKYKGKLSMHYVTELLNDPSRYGGILRKASKAYAEGKAYQPSNYEEWVLHSQAERALAPEVAGKFSPDQLMEVAIQKVKLTPELKEKIARAEKEDFEAI